MGFFTGTGAEVIVNGNHYSATDTMVSVIRILVDRVACYIDKAKQTKVLS